MSLQTAITQELRNASRILELKLKEAITRQDSIATGELLNSVRVRVDDNGLVISMNEYAQYIEEGRKPGTWAPVNAIRNWVRVKLNVPASQVNSVAFLVNRKIFLEGIKAKPFIEDAIQDWIKDTKRDLEDRLANSNILKKEILLQLGI